MATVNLQLPHHQYQVLIEPGVLEHIGPILHTLVPHPRCALLADQTVAQLHGQKVEDSLRSGAYEVVTHTIPSGESYKTLDTVRELYDVLLDAHMERRSPVIALGGGVTGDMAGFVAATYLRGVPFVQCPTTLLAMVDASVGGKVGVNVSHGKNLIGAFHQPHAVMIDPLVLKTLPAREIRCGLAECVKHGVIRDAELFNWTADNLDAILALDPQVMVELLRRNVQIKADVVMEDEKEIGVRAHLNFGHTFAHAIEATAGYGRIEHGEAVSLGMVAATKLAIDAGRCDANVLTQLTQLLTKIGLPVQAELAPTADLMAAMMHDKKVKDNRIRLVLPDRLGAVSIVNDTPIEQIEQAWQAIRG